MKVNKIKAVILSMFLGGIKSSKENCKNALKLSALSLIDNGSIILDNEYWIKYLPNMEQQKFYDDEYYRRTVKKWSNMQDINVSDCLKNRTFYLKSLKNKDWYEEAKKIYMNGYLIFPLSRPVIPNIKAIGDMYNAEYLKDKVIYFSMNDYIKCIEEKNEDKCEGEKENIMTTVKETLIDIVSVMGLFVTGKVVVTCIGNMVSSCFREAFSTVDRNIALLWERDARRMIGEGRRAAIDDDSSTTAIESEYELEMIEMQDDKMSQRSDITLVEDFENEVANEVIDLTEVNREVRNRDIGTDNIMTM